MKVTPVLSGSYDIIAAPYAEWVHGGKLIHHFVIPPLLRLVGSVAGQQVLDLACGEGIMARELARLGASTWGVDVSAQLLEFAEKEENAHPLGIVYVQDDAHSLAQFEAGFFDTVVCNMALTDLKDLEQAARAIARVLHSGGAFVFSMPHPAFQTAPGAAWGIHPSGTVQAQVAGYFDEVPRETAWSGGQVVTYHRTLETLVNTLARAGLVLTRIAEPQAPVDFKPGYDQVPGVLLGRCVKLISYQEELVRMTDRQSRRAFNVCVFAGWEPGEKPIYLQYARMLGQALAERQMALVFGGTLGGLMGAVAEVVAEEGGRVTGVVPETYWPDLLFTRGQLETVANLGERVERMALLADAFVVLPGGVGTLHELFAVLTQAQISREKPIIVCNVGDFFTPLLTYLDSLVDAGFVQPRARRRIQSVSRLEDVLAMLESTRLAGVI
jgi:hypothetical protein